MRKICFFLIFCLIGCSYAPLDTAQEDFKAKHFVAGNVKKSYIYFYRDETLMPNFPISVLFDDRIVGQTTFMTFFLWEIDPGVHRIVSQSENISSVTIDALPGKIYYVWQEVGFGWSSPRTFLHLVDEETGKAGVLRCKKASNDLFASPQGGK